MKPRPNQTLRRSMLLAAIGTVLTLNACTAAPLYTSTRLPKGAVTGGEVPRDARGEPLWSAIEPVRPENIWNPRAQPIPDHAANANPALPKG